MSPDFLLPLRSRIARRSLSSYKLQVSRSSRHDTRKRNIQATNLEGSDDNVGGVDANRGSSSVALLNVDSVDVDDPLLPVDLDTKTFCQTISTSPPFEFSIV